MDGFDDGRRVGREGSHGGEPSVPESAIGVQGLYSTVAENARTRRGCTGAIYTLHGFVLASSQVREEFLNVARLETTNDILGVLFPVSRLESYEHQHTTLEVLGHSCSEG